MSAAFPYDSPVLTRGRAERLNMRIVEGGSAVRKSVREAAERNGDAFVGRLVSGQGHLSGIARGMGRNVGAVSLLYAMTAAFGLVVAVFGIGLGAAMVGLMPEGWPREVLWLAEVLPVTFVVGGLAVTYLCARRLFARNVDDIAGIPRRLLRESTLCLGVGRDRLYVGTLHRGLPQVREIAYADVGPVRVVANGLEIQDNDKRPILTVGGCWEEAGDTALQAVVAHLRERTAR